MVIQREVSRTNICRFFKDSEVNLRELATEG